MVEHSAVNRGVVGSSPTRGVFRLRGQAVKTSPFHGGNTSSILVGVTKILQDYNSKWFLARVRLANASLFARCGAQGALNLVGVTHADVAQLAEQLICNQQVTGSIPAISSFPLRVLDL